MTPKLPDLLVRYLREKRCVVFVGAGLSAGAGLPTWGALLKLGIEELVRSLPEGETHQDELQELVKRGKLLEVAEFCRDKLGPAYHQFLTDQVRGDTEELPETHQLLMQLPFSAWVTTNYDKLLERAYAEVKKGGYPRTLTHMDTEQLGRLLFEGGPFILKAHGDIDRPDTVVLTSHDYSEIIHANPAFNEAFSGLLLTKALFFVGYSLSDPDFRLLLDRQLTHFKGFVPERFALMMDVGPVEREVLWRTARIRVISYEKDKHELVLHFLRALKAAVFQEPVPQSGGVKTGVIAERKAVMEVVSQNMGEPGRSGPAWVKQPEQSFSSPVPAPAPMQPPAVRPAGGAPPVAPRTGSHILLESFTRGLDDDLGVVPEAEDSPREAEHVSFSSPPPGAKASQPASTGPDELVLNRLPFGQVLFWLVRQQQAVAQGVTPAALDQKMLLTLQGAINEGRAGALPVSRYAEITRTFEQYGSRKLREALDASGPTSRESLVLRLIPSLARFPWELLPINGQPMCLQRKVVRAPFGVAAEAQRAPGVRSSPRVLLIEGPGGRRGGAPRELQRIAEKYQSHPGFACTVLQGTEATFERVTAELDVALPDLVHYTGEVGRVDGELFLRLSGNLDLSEGTLRSVLSRGRLPFLVLNAASSAFAPPVLGWYATGARPQRLPAPSSEAFVFEGREGFMDLATETGVGAFVGTFDMPSAEAGTDFMALLHRDLVAGLTIAEAVLRARQEVHQRFAGDPTALQYVLSGDGELRLWDSRREDIQG